MDHMGIVIDDLAAATAFFDAGANPDLDITSTEMLEQLVGPVRHHARYVRSFASRVRRVASRASLSSALTGGSSSVVRLFLRGPT
jgi:hypothetical protein